MKLERNNHGFACIFEIKFIITEFNFSKGCRIPFNAGDLVIRSAIGVGVATFDAGSCADLYGVFDEDIIEVSAQESASCGARGEIIDITIVGHFAQIGASTFDGAESAITLREERRGSRNFVIFINGT